MIPGRQVIKLAVINTDNVYPCVLRIHVLTKPFIILPASIAMIKLIYSFVISFFIEIYCVHKPATKPYTASSIIICGNIIAGGIPVITLEMKGVKIPHAKPYGHPQNNPQINTGMCIGKNMLPAFGIT